MTRTRSGPNQPVEGTRSVSTWWTIGSSLVIGIFGFGILYGTSQGHFERLDRETTRIAGESAENKRAIADVKETGGDKFQPFTEAVEESLKNLNRKLDKITDTQTQQIRVITRVAAHIGVSDE